MVAELAPRADLTGRQRLIADRFRRIWAIVERIAAEPGHSRLELSEVYHLSERQVQADLNIIRTDLRLPLVRDRGYRFVANGGSNPATNVSLTDALTLVAVIAKARRDRGPLTFGLDSLVSRLPSMFPIHLQPLARYALTSPIAPALIEAILSQSAVRLQYPLGATPYLFDPTSKPLIEPQLLIPYLDSWFVIGFCPELHRTKMLRLDAVQNVAGVP